MSWWRRQRLKSWEGHQFHRLFFHLAFKLICSCVQEKEAIPRCSSSSFLLPSGFSMQSPQSTKSKHRDTNFASTPRSLQDKSCFESSKPEVHPVPRATSATEAPQQHLGWNSNVFFMPFLPTLLFHRSHSHSTGRFLQCLCLWILRKIQFISVLGHSFCRWRMLSPT